MTRHSSLHVLAASVATVGLSLVALGATSAPVAADYPSVDAGSSITVPFTCNADALGMMVDVFGPDGASDFVNWVQAGSAQDVVWNVPAWWPGGATRLAGVCTYDGPMPLPVDRYVDVVAGAVQITTTTEAPVASTTSTTEVPLESTTSTTEAPVTSITSTTAPVTTPTVPPASTTVPPSPPAADGSLDVSDTTWTPGTGTITAVATGYAPGSIVHFYVYSTPHELGSAVAGANGVATLDVTVPPGLPEGAHTVVSYGVDAAGINRVLAQHVMFTAPATAASAASAPTPAAQEAPNALARTGSSSAGKGALGITLVLAGAGLEAVARRRTTAAHS